MEDDSKFRFGGVRDAVDDFIDEFEEVDEERSRHGAATSVGPAAAAPSSSTAATNLSPCGFVMMSEDERRELVQRLQAAASAPPPSLHLRWRLSHPSQQLPDAAAEEVTNKEAECTEAEAEQQVAEEQQQAEEAFEKEEEVRLADEGLDQTWTFTADSLSFNSVPFLESTERAPQPVSAPQRSTSPWSLVERPTPATTSADGAHHGQSDNATAEEAEVSGGGSDPWVTIDKQPEQSQQPSPRTAHASAAEVDKYIEEEFELTKLSARELKNAESLRDEQAYAKLKKGQSFLSSAKAKLMSQWSSTTIPADRNKCVQGLRSDIRKGVPDSKRAQVWRTAVGCVEFERAYPNYYADVLERVFGHRLPTRFYQVPAFGGELRPGEHYLTTHGLTAAARLLWALTMEYPDIDYVPAIPDLVCVLLTFLSEADAYLVTHLMLEQSRANRWYLCLTNRTLTLFLHTFRSLIAKCLPDVSAHMDVLGVEAEHFADVWFKRVFVGSLPFLTVLRIYDCYLAEGSHVLYRVGLAILQGCRRALLRCDTATGFVATVEQVALQMVDADGLLKAAFGLSFQQKHTSAFDKANKTKLAGVSEPLYQPLVMPNITETSELMDEVQFQALWSIIPSRFTIRDPKLLFSTTQHGFSLSSLLEKCDDVHPAVLLIRDKNRRVFGAFSTEGLRLCRQFENYYGTREDFLFTLVPEVKVWPWLAGHAKHFVRITMKGIKFGDAKGLCVDEELWHGTSEKSKTFENEPLSGDTIDFDCLSLEVWGFK